MDLREKIAAIIDERIDSADPPSEIDGRELADRILDLLHEESVRGILVLPGEPKPTLGHSISTRPSGD